MNHKEGDIRKICYSCAHIYNSEETSTLICPKCGFNISQSAYEDIMKNVRQAVFEGWTCRREYETEVDGVRYYTEQLGEVWNFIALAIVSGLIGNISYDIVKKVFNSIISSIKNGIMSREDREFIDFLESPEHVKLFYEYISAYYNEYENLDAELKNKILEEVFVYNTSTIIDGLLKQKYKGLNIDDINEKMPYSKKEILKKVLDMNFSKNEKLIESNFNNFWTNI